MKRISTDLGASRKPKRTFIGPIDPGTVVCKPALKWVYDYPNWRDKDIFAVWPARTRKAIDSVPDRNRIRECGRDQFGARDEPTPTLALYLLTRDDVVELHDIAVREHRGSLGFRDDNALLLALARPQNLLLYGEQLDLFDVAASLAFGIMRSHPFQDGNKRSSWIAIQVTLISNGIDNKVHSEDRHHDSNTGNDDARRVIG